MVYASDEEFKKLRDLVDKATDDWQLKSQILDQAVILSKAFCKDALGEKKD